MTQCSTMESSEVSDEDLIHFIKNILQSRPFPIHYKSLRELVGEAPPRLKSYADSNYTEEKFLNFLLSHSSLFSVSPDGSVILLGASEYVFPQAMDALDSIPASDDSYFGDREEYISESEEESNGSMDSDRHLLSHEVLSNVLVEKSSHNKLQSASSQPVHQIDCYGMTSLHDMTSSSDSTPLYLSSSNSRSSTTTESDSQSSFESCDEVNEKSKLSDSCSTTSSSYSSCSDS